MLTDVTGNAVEPPVGDGDRADAGEAASSLEELLAPERIDQLLADAEAEDLAIDIDDLVLSLCARGRSTAEITEGHSR